MSYNPFPQPADVVVLTGIGTSAVSFSNPFPVSLGSSSITINGDITIPGIVSVTSSPDNPIHNHIVEVGTGGTLTTPYLPVGISTLLNTVTIGNTVSISNTSFYVTGVGSTVNIQGTVGIGTTGQVSINVNNAPVSNANPLPVSLGSSSINATFSGVSTVSLANNFQLDLFGRLKVSQPYTIFDNVNRYELDGQFSDVILGAGSSVGIITAQSTSTLGIGTTAGCSVIRETKKVFSYQPGKSLQVLQTFVFNPAKANLIQRAGYASSENGVMIELNGSQINIIKRTAISGVGTTVTVPQSQWNVDKLDGTGVSGVNLDLSKAQILFTEYEWLGVGAVRVGFINANGNAQIAHIFNHANTLDSVYMTTATLPCRYEILNTGITTSASTMKQICISVQSNGGYEKKVAESVARMTTTTNVATSFEPLVSIRLAPGREDAVVLLKQYAVLPTSADSFEIAVIKNATLTDASWTATSSSNVQQDTSATSLTGGTIMMQDYTVATNQSSIRTMQDIEYNWDLQLGRTQAKVSDTYTLAARVLSGTGDIIGALSFFDLT